MAGHYFAIFVAPRHKNGGLDKFLPFGYLVRSFKEITIPGNSFSTGLKPHHSEMIRELRLTGDGKAL